MNSVNELAPFISVSFLLVFAATNLTCATLDLSAAPNFRYASILTGIPIHFKYLKSGVCANKRLCARISCVMFTWNCAQADVLVLPLGALDSGRNLVSPDEHVDRAVQHTSGRTRLHNTAGRPLVPTAAARGQLGLNHAGTHLRTSPALSTSARRPQGPCTCTSSNIRFDLQYTLR